MAEKRIEVAPHPSRSASNRLVWTGGVLGALAVGAGALGAPVVAISLAVLGGTWAALGVYQSRLGRGVQLINQSLNELTAGRLAAVDRLLDAAEAEVRTQYLLRVVDLHRVSVHLRRGQLELALERANRALARPLGLLTRSHERLHIAELQAMRALVRAALSDRDGARADVAAVRASQYALPTALARAALAEAMLLERSGERAALRQHLRDNRQVLLEEARPRERAIVRAYQRMLRVTSTTAYREPAPREAEEREEPPLAEWVATMAPAAARFVSAPRAAGPQPPTPPVHASAVDPQLQASAEQRFQAKPTKRLWLRTLVLWVVLIVLFISIWQFFTPDPSALPPVEADAPVAPLVTLMLWLLPIGLVLVIAVAFAKALLRTRLHERRLLAATRQLSGGERERAEAELLELARSRWDLTAAQACLLLAKSCARRADWAGTLSHSDAGIARIRSSETSRIAASDYVLPDLHAQRAVALAARSQRAEAAAELGLIARHFPAFPLLALAQSRVALIGAVRAGDLPAAVRAAEEAGDDLPLAPGEELLRDVVRAAHEPERAGPAEIERLREELRTDIESRRWIEALDGGLPDALVRCTQSTDEPDPGEEERELLAEAEAAAHERGAVATRTS